MKTIVVFVVLNIFPLLYCFSRNLNPWLSITTPKGERATRNFTVYVGYANDPFGSSTRISLRNNSNNTFPQAPFPDIANLQFSSNQLASSKDELDQSLVALQYAGVQEPRTKRGVIHLYNMVSCATGCNPLIYKGYGCFCGFLGSGYAVDGIDRCCKMHDWCYDTANCPMFLEYLVPYYWKCYYNKPLCALDHGEYGGSGSCAQRLCECDRVLSECLSRHPCPSSRAICRSSPWRLLQNAFMNF